MVGFEALSDQHRGVGCGRQLVETYKEVPGALVVVVELEDVEEAQSAVVGLRDGGGAWPR